MNTSLIKTANGLTITVKHTVSTPHPYDRINLIAGTKGIFEDYPPRIYFDGMNKDEAWGDRSTLANNMTIRCGNAKARWREGRRPWRHGLHHALSPAAMRPRGPAARYGCVRRSGVVRGWLRSASVRQPAAACPSNSLTLRKANGCSAQPPASRPRHKFRSQNKSGKAEFPSGKMPPCPIQIGDMRTGYSPKSG